MFEFIRTHQRLMQFVLLVLVVPSFALIGVSGYSTYVSGDQKLVEVGKSAVTLEDFDRARRSQLENIQASMGGAFDPAVFDTPQARAELLDGLIDRRLILDQAIENRLSVSDAVLRRQIAAIPEFQDNGRFSQDRYTAVLNANGYSSREFEEGQRGEMALQRVLGPVGQTAHIPGPVSKAIKGLLTEERQVQVRTFDASDYGAEVSVSDDEIKSWYDSNQDKLQVPQSVTAQYLVLNEAAAMKGLPSVDDEQLLAYYQQNKSRYMRPGRSKLSHILIEADADDAEAVAQARQKADTIAQQAAAQPDTFAALAQEQSDDAGSASSGGELGWVTPGSWPAALESTAFALKAGEVSGAVRGPDGFHVFMALEVEPEQGETFEQARSKVEAEVARQLGAERFAEMASQLTDLVYDHPETLEPAASTLGLELKSAAGIAADQLLPSAFVQEAAAIDSTDETILADPRVRRALFSSSVLSDRHNSGVIEISPDTIVVMRVQDVSPAHVQAFDQAVPSIRDYLSNQQATALARKAGEQAFAALTDSADTDAQGFGEQIAISRFAAHNLDKATLDAAFALKPESLPAYGAAETPNGYAIVRVNKVGAADIDATSLAGIDRSLGQAQAEAERRAVLNALRHQAGVTFLPEATEALQGDDDSNS